MSPAIPYITGCCLRADWQFCEDYHHLKRHVQMWDVAVERRMGGADAES